MQTKPIPVRFEPSLLRLLNEGAKRTPHKKQELIRLTLRRHLAAVIEEESNASARRVTNVKPWDESELRKAYARVGNEWDALEEAATRAQGRPDLND
ncbi:MAG TPA: hypothetical protein VF773_21665 [Verrucomicrobiae bacterium]